MARSYQPGLIIVDRAVEGPFQNYLTPEQAVPNSLLPYPWETCMTMATSWSYVSNDTYKSTYELIKTLCTVVSRGGNFLLNIAPGPQGDWDPVAYERLQEIGAWMNINGEAIYKTTPAFTPIENNIVATLGRNELYLIFFGENETAALPAQIRCLIPAMERSSEITLLGTQGKLKWSKEGEVVIITIPESLRKAPPCKYAWVFKIQ